MLSRIFLEMYLSLLLSQVTDLFNLVNYEPEQDDQPYHDAWTIRHLLSYACKRQHDSSRRGQTPRASRLLVVLHCLLDGTRGVST